MVKNPFIPQQQPWTRRYYREQDAEQHLLAMGSDAFSALTATLAVVMNMPPVMVFPLFIVGFVLLFVVHKMAD